MLVSIKSQSVNLPALELADLLVHGQNTAPELKWIFRKEKRYAMVNIRGWSYIADADDGFQAEIHTDLNNAVRYASIQRVLGEHCDISIADARTAKTPGEALAMAYRTSREHPPTRWPVCPGPPDRVYTPEHRIPPGEQDNSLSIPVCRRCANAAGIRAISKRINPALQVQPDPAVIRPYIHTPNTFGQWRVGENRLRYSRK